jgi:recombination protein RecA
MSATELLDKESLSPVTHYISTGCTLLDLAISNTYPGGFGAGRISHIYGPESSSKSIIAMEPLGSAQRQGGKAYLIETEAVFDESRAQLFGIDTNKDFFVKTPLIDGGTTSPITIEFLFDGLISMAEKETIKEYSNKPSVMSIDSLSAIPSSVELSEAMDASSYGMTRAKMLSKGFRTHIEDLGKSNLGLVFVDQTRVDVGSQHNKKTFGGGEALKFYATTRIYLQKKTDIKNKYDKTIGIEVFFRVDKNKIAPPFREGSFFVLFDYGIDDIGTNLKWMKENNPELTKEQQKSGWYTIGDQKFNGLTNAVSAVEENEWEEWLRQEVARLWHLIYQPVDRKRKLR